MHRRFILFRKHDVSGVSGTGVIAEGTQYSTGKVTIHWTVKNKPQSIVVYDSVEEAVEVHGHEGNTEIEWID